MNITERARALKAQDMSLREIGAKLGLSHQAIFFRLGGQRSVSRIPPAANDNKIVKMMPHNGGCSTTSGEAAVSLRLVPTMQTAEVAPSARELQMQVAA